MGNLICELIGQLLCDVFFSVKKKKKMYHLPFLLKFPSLRMQTSARNLSRKNYSKFLTYAGDIYSAVSDSVITKETCLPDVSI